MAEAVVKLGDGNWATKEGKLLAHKQVGDKYLNTEFTVTRGTDATYVGRDGLIKQMSDASPELIQNGDFSATGIELVTDGDFSSSANWYAGTGCTISGNQGVFTSAPSGSGFTGNNLNAAICEVGKSYKVTYTIDSITSGSVGLRHPLTGTYYDNTSSFPLDVTEYVVADDTDIYIQNSGTTTATISNVSVKELGEDWSSMDGAIDSYNENGLTITSINTDLYNRLRQNSITEDGKSYKVTYTIQATSFSAGTVIQYYDGDSYNALPKQGVGTHTFYYTRDAENDAWYFNLDASASASTTDYVTISSISVKQISDIVGDIPRIDFLNNPEGHLLLEPARTNLYGHSEPTAQEGSEGGSVTYENFSWDLGFTNCVRFPSNGESRYRYGSTVVASTEYTISAYVIMDDLSEPVLGANVNLGDLGFVLSGSFLGGGLVESMGNNIWRISKTATSGSSLLSNNGIIAYNTQSGKGFRTTGFQVEAGTYPTSYIPTNGVAVTRATETCTGAGDTTSFNGTGVMYCEMASLGASTYYGGVYLISPDDNSIGNNMQIRYHGGVDNQLQSIIYTTRQQNVHAQYSFLDGTALGDQTLFKKFAIKYESDGITTYYNGVQDGKIDSPTQGQGVHAAHDAHSEVAAWSGENPTMAGNPNQLKLSGTGFKIKAIHVYKEALSDADIIALTS